MRMPIAALDNVYVLNLVLIWDKLSDFIAHQSRIMVQSSKVEDTEAQKEKKGIPHYTIRIRKKINFSYFCNIL